MYFDEVKYYLTTELAGRVLLGTPPMGWDEDNKELVRSTQFWGVLTNLSDALQFVNDGAELISSAYEALGTETKITLERYVNVGLSGFELDYIGNIDLKTYSFENDKVSVEFLTGGLQSLIESQFDEDFELGRETDINGNEITPLEFKKMFWEGRKILLQTYYETAEDAEITPTGNIRVSILNDYDTVHRVCTLPITILAESDNQFQNVSNASTFIYASWLPGDVSANKLFLFANRDFESRILLNASCDITFSEQYNDMPSTVQLYIAPFLLKYRLNASTSQLEYQGRQQIGNDIYFLPKDGISETVTYEVNEEIGDIDIIDGDRFAIVFQMGFFAPQGTIDEFYLKEATIINLTANVVFSEDSVFPSSKFNVIRTHDVGDRLLEIITGKKGLFKSQFFGKQSDGYLENSLFEKTVITSGELIRQIPITETNPDFGTIENGRITIALKDIFELNNYFNLGWGIERVGSFEQFVLEEKSYFLKRIIGIELGEVDEFKKNCASEFLYKSLTFGNEKAGEYEEVQGRSEYNVLNTFTTPLQTSDDSYDVQGKVRADLIPAEITRRKQFDKNPSTDTKYDKENFIFHVKDTDADLINIREWQDDFETEPIVYDPNTAGNLLLTPFRSLQRHANFFKSGMIPNNNDLIRYSSTTGNSEIGTQILNEVVRFENGSIVINEMAAAIFKAEYYEFSFPTTHEIRKKLFSKMNGLPVPYFLITFTFREQNYSGWLINVSTNNVGNWKLIKNDN
jgi:hypothetical protein